MDVNPTHLPIPPLDRHELERNRRADPLRYGLAPGEGYQRLWARVQAEPADQPWYRRFGMPAPRLALSGAAGALVLVLAMGLGGSAEMPTVAEAPYGEAAPTIVSDSATEGGGRALGPASVDQPPADCPDKAATDPTGHDFAFDGTVTTSDSQSATFLVHQDFVSADGYATQYTSVRTPSRMRFEPGRRYLVAGDEGLADACLSQPYSESLAQQWASASN